MKGSEYIAEVQYLSSFFIYPLRAEDKTIKAKDNKVLPTLRKLKQLILDGLNGCRCQCSESVISISSGLISSIETLFLVSATLSSWIKKYGNN